MSHENRGKGLAIRSPSKRAKLTICSPSGAVGAAKKLPARPVRAEDEMAVKATTKTVSRDNVFVAGGLPTVTYIVRSEADIERELARAIAAPNQIVSLAGPSKSGKTVLCQHALSGSQYIWIDGGQTPSVDEFWARVYEELNFPIHDKEAPELKPGFMGMLFSSAGSQLAKAEAERDFEIKTMAAAVRHLQDNGISLVVDDFHYIAPEARAELLRNIKGAIFRGLRVILLSVTHRAFDAIKAEKELTGRFVSVKVPEWTHAELSQIPIKGFAALNVECPKALITELANECQSSPFLMQKLCWEICYELNITTKAAAPMKIKKPVMPKMYQRIAKDAALPVFERLMAGPTIGKERMKRPLKKGGEADVYEATVIAIAETGPAAALSWAEINTALKDVLSAQIPKGHEISSALKQMSKISQEVGGDSGLDWDEGKKQLNITDPFLRFFLRWQVRKAG